MPLLTLQTDQAPTDEVFEVPTATQSTLKVQLTPGGSGGAVSSVFGRIGAVVAAVADYAASQVTNDSTVAGLRVSNALDTLKSSIASLVTGVSSVFGRAGAVVAAAGDYTSSQITNASAVPGATTTAALNVLNTHGFFHFYSIASSATTAARFFLRSGGTVSINETQGQVTAGRACTLTTIRVSFAVASPTDTITFTLRINGVNTAIVLAVPANQLGGVATGFAVAVAAGDRLSMQFTQSGTDNVSSWNCDAVVY